MTGEGGNGPDPVDDPTITELLTALLEQGPL